MNEQTTASGLGRRIALLIASVGGIGRCPVASGTAASAATVVGYLLLPGDMAVQLAVIACVLVLAVWSSGVCVGSSGSDPSYIVIDEVAGMLIACFLVPPSLPNVAAAFLLFRMFDIGKWFPMKQLERLPGGWGILADDVAAGLLARFVLGLWV